MTFDKFQTVVTILWQHSANLADFEKGFAKIPPPSDPPPKDEYDFFLREMCPYFPGPKAWKPEVELSAEAQRVLAWREKVSEAANLSSTADGFFETVAKLLPQPKGVSNREMLQHIGYEFYNFQRRSIQDEQRR